MRRLALGTMAISFLLVIAGGLVTSTDSGLSVPDWPLSYGRLFPPMVGGIRFEQTHRMIAAFVGLLTLILTLWLLVKEKRRWVRSLGIFAFGMVVAQGILGGLTVLWKLPSAVSVAHACLGQTFFATLAVLATVLSPAPAISQKGLAWPPMLLVTLAIYAQLILGAALRHTRWAIPLVAAHAAWALVVFVLIMKSAGQLLSSWHQEPYVRQPAKALIWLLLLQIILGLSTLLTGGGVWVSTGHVAVGALMLAISAVLTVRLSRMAGTGRGERKLSAYLELAKPRLTSLAVLTSGLGFVLGAPGPLDWIRLAAALSGTLLVGAGAGALNQLLEKEADSRMTRTRSRPLPSGRLNPESALAFGVSVSMLGLAILTFGCNLLSGFLAALTLVLYLFLYTPLKRRSALCTLVGAGPGAIPPLIGWAAARGTVGLEALFLFAILFLWQLPHFLAIAWIHRKDYEQAGFKLLPVLDPEGGSTSRQIALYCLALIPVSLLPAVWGWASLLYFLAAFLSSLIFLSLGLLTACQRSSQSARQLFLASIAYLPFLLAILTLDRVIS